MALQECPCGSGKWPQPRYDARGIFLCYICSQCEDIQMSKYRQDVLTDSNYWHDEPIEEE